MEFYYVEDLTENDALKSSYIVACELVVAVKFLLNRCLLKSKSVYR
jgi:hypothetical protein